MKQEAKCCLKVLLNRVVEECKKLIRNPIRLVVVLLCIVLFAVAVWSTGALRTKSRMTSFGMKNIGELATQSGYFTVVNVIDDNVELWGWSVPLTESKYIFSYDGIVKAGLDFSKLDYKVNELTNEIVVSIPEVEIQSVELQEDSLEIYDEMHNIFTPLGLADIQESRLTMIDEIRTKALENGLLEQAKVNAQMLISGFLSGQYDLSEYHIVFKEVK